MSKIQYLIDIKEITIEGERSYCIPVYVSKLSFLHYKSREAERELNGLVTKIEILENSCVFMTSKGDRYELKNYEQLNNHISQLVWLMSVSKDASKITFCIDSYFGNFLRLFKEDSYFDLNLKSIRCVLEEANFKIDKRLTLKSDDETYSVLVYNKYMFGIDYHNRDIFHWTPKTTYYIVRANYTIIEYTYKNGTEFLYCYYEIGGKLQKEDITNTTEDFIKRYCGRNCNLGMVFNAIKNNAFSFEESSFELEETIETHWLDGYKQTE